MRRILWIVVVLGGLLTAIDAGAATLAPIEFEDSYSPAHEELVIPRALAMGEAFVSIAQENTAYYFNPAGMAQKTMYSIGVDSNFDFYGDTMSFGASIMDSATTVVCMQAGYTYHGYAGRQLWNTNDWAWLDNTDNAADYYLVGERDSKPVETNYSLVDEYRVDDFRKMYGVYKRSRVHRHIPRVALAGAINRYFFLGVTFKYVYAQRPGRHSVNSGNVDVGMMIDTGVGVKIGVAAYNLIHTAYDLWPLKLAAGISYTYEDIFTIAYDQVVIFDVFQEKEPYTNLYDYPKGTRLAYRAGAEFVAGGVVAIRAGFQYDETADNMYVTSGLAYVDDIFSISAAYSQGLWDKQDRLMGLGFQVEVK